MANRTAPTPGQLWPDQRGLFSAVITPSSGNPWALLLPTDVPKLSNQPWGEYGRLIAGADDAIDGHAATLAMAEAGNELALAVRALPGDCYLPSRVEALMLFLTLKKQVGTGAIWTSTQYSAYNAWYQHFSHGNQHTTSKDCEFRAVPVRRSILRSFVVDPEPAA